MTSTGPFTRITGATVDGIAVMTLASDKVNALDVETLGEIAAYVGRCEDDPEVRALVVTGAGSIFSAGLNVSEVLDNEKSRTGVLLESLNTALVGLFRFAKPTVAAINGPAIAGGCILACACDKRVIAEGARIGATELRVGVSFPVFAVELLGDVARICICICRYCSHCGRGSAKAICSAFHGRLTTARTSDCGKPRPEREWLSKSARRSRPRSMPRPNAVRSFSPTAKASHGRLTAFAPRGARHARWQASSA